MLLIRVQRNSDEDFIARRSVFIFLFTSICCYFVLICILPLFHLLLFFSGTISVVNLVLSLVCVFAFCCDQCDSASTLFSIRLYPLCVFTAAFFFLRVCCCCCCSCHLHSRRAIQLGQLMLIIQTALCVLNAKAFRWLV